MGFKVPCLAQSKPRPGILRRLLARKFNPFSYLPLLCSHENLNTGSALIVLCQGIYGVVEACQECENAFYFCFKCCSRKGEFHPQHTKYERKDADKEFADDEEQAEDADTSDHNESAGVQQLEDDDEEGDWSNDEN